MQDQLFGEEQASYWVGVDKQLRRSLYGLMHEILLANRLSTLIYKLLLLIEGLQIVFFSINTSFDFLWDSEVTNAMQQAIQYFQFNGPIRNVDKTVYFIMLYAVLSIHVITGLSIIYCLVVMQKKKKISSLFNYIIKYLSFYGIIVNTIGFLPMFNIYINTIYCQKSSKLGQKLDPYTGIYFLHVALAVFGLIIFMIIQWIFYKLYFEMNPCSTTPFAQPQTSNNIIKLILKMILPVYTVIDPDGDYGKPFIICFLIYLGFQLVNRYITSPYYHKDIQTVSIIIDSSIFWTGFVTFICAYVDEQPISILFIFCGIPFVSVTALWLIRSRYSRIQTLNMKNFKKDSEVELYIILLIHLIENRNKYEEYIILEGVVKLHSRQCNKVQDVNCNCQSLILDKDDDFTTMTQNQSINSNNSKKWYTFLKFLLNDGFEKFQKSARLHLLHAYIQHGKLSNKFKALLELMVTTELKPNFQEEFSIYRYNHIIEDEIGESDQRNVENRTVQVNNIVNFQNSLVEFFGSIEISVASYYEFWNKLLEELPDVQKLLYLGSKITNSVERNQDLFEELQNMNPNHIKCLTIYGYYLKDIVNDDQEGNRLLEKAEYVDRSNQANKQLIDQEKLKYGENSNTTIITISGNLNQIGIISNSNNEIFELLGYQKNDIIGQNVNKIMPKIYGNLHDGFLHRYLETSESKIIGLERTVMCLNKKGYLIPCSIMIKVLPNLDYGIQMVGFLKEIENNEVKSQLNRENITHYLIYREDTLQIQGITESVHDYFGIPAQIIYGNSQNVADFTIDSIAPGIVDFSNRAELLSPQGLLTTIDSTYVQMNYLIDEDGDSEIMANNQQNDDDNDGEDNNNYDDQQIQNNQVKMKKFRQAQIKVNLISEQEFDDGIKVNVITFVEIDNNNDIQNDFVEDGQNLQNLKTTVKGVTPYNKNELSQHNEKEEEEMDDEGSNVSSSSANEEQRHLKDFKALISERTIPKSIKVLNRTALVLILILITLSGYDLGFKVTNETEVKEAMDSINSGYVITSTLSSVIYQVSELNQLANSLIEPPSGTDATAYSNKLKSTLEAYVSQLQTEIFDMVKYQISMNSKRDSSNNSTQYPISKMLTTGVVQTNNEGITDSFLTFITQSTGLKSQTLDSIKAGSAKQNLYYIYENGQKSLRIAAYDTSEDFYNYYYYKVGDFIINYEIVLIIAISFLVISLCILIPIVFQVNRTNNKVLSLFGYIPYPEIKQLADKCDNYIHQHISTKDQEERGVDEEWNNENDGPTSKYNQNKNGILDQNQRIINDEHDELKSTPQDGALNNGLAQQRSLQDVEKPKNQGKQNGKNNNDKQTEDHEFIDHRSQLLLNQKDGSKKSVIIRFGFVASLFILQYVLHFVFDVQYINDCQDIFYHFKLSNLRPSYIQWTQIFTQLQIETDQINVNSEGTNLRTYYDNKMYEVEKLIGKFFNFDFPQKLDDYKSLFKQAQTSNICIISKNATDLSLCQSVNNGVLQRGFQTAVVSFVLELNTITEDYKKTGKTTDDKKAILNSDRFKQLQNQMGFMIPMMQQLNEDLVYQTGQFLSNRTKVEIIVFSVYMIVILASFLMIWMPYMQRINLKIWRTKGMLNMIPMEVINKHESLKNAFISGDILSAVK